jgi:hypothetical protein
LPNNLIGRRLATEVSDVDPHRGAVAQTAGCCCGIHVDAHGFSDVMATRKRVPEAILNSFRFHISLSKAPNVFSAVFALVVGELAEPEAN